jgi:DNA-binding CsgD family transcriptional regulator
MDPSLLLTNSEQHCVYWIAHGYSNQSISKLMACSTHTVNNHLRRIFEKTGMSTRLELLLWVWNKGYFGK